MENFNEYQIKRIIRQTQKITTLICYHKSTNTPSFIYKIPKIILSSQQICFLIYISKQLNTPPKGCIKIQKTLISQGFIFFVTKCYLSIKQLIDSSHQINQPLNILLDIINGYSQLNRLYQKNLIPDINNVLYSNGKIYIRDFGIEKKQTNQQIKMQYGKIFHYILYKRFPIPYQYIIIQNTNSQYYYFLKILMKSTIPLTQIKYMIQQSLSNKIKMSKYLSQKYFNQDNYILQQNNCKTDQNKLKKSQEKTIKNSQVYKKRSLQIFSNYKCNSKYKNSTLHNFNHQRIFYSKSGTKRSSNIIFQNYSNIIQDKKQKVKLDLFMKKDDKNKNCSQRFVKQKYHNLSKKQKNYKMFNSSRKFNKQELSNYQSNVIQLFKNDNEKKKVEKKCVFQQNEKQNTIKYKSQIHSRIKNNLLNSKKKYKQISKKKNKQLLKNKQKIQVNNKTSYNNDAYTIKNTITNTDSKQNLQDIKVIHKENINGKLKLSLNLNSINKQESEGSNVLSNIQQKHKKLCEYVTNNNLMYKKEQEKQKEKQKMKKFYQKYQKKKGNFQMQSINININNNNYNMYSKVNSQKSFNQNLHNYQIFKQKNIQQTTNMVNQNCKQKINPQKITNINQKNQNNPYYNQIKNYVNQLNLSNVQNKQIIILVNQENKSNYNNINHNYNNSQGNYNKIINSKYQNQFFYQKNNQIQKNRIENSKTEKIIKKQQQKNQKKNNDCNQNDLKNLNNNNVQLKVINNNKIILQSFNNQNNNNILQINNCNLQYFKNNNINNNCKKIQQLSSINNNLKNNQEQIKTSNGQFRNNNNIQQHKNINENINNTSISLNKMQSNTINNPYIPSNIINNDIKNMNNKNNNNNNQNQKQYKKTSKQYNLSQQKQINNENYSKIKQAKKKYEDIDAQQFEEINLQVQIKQNYKQQKEIKQSNNNNNNNNNINQIKQDQKKIDNQFKNINKKQNNNMFRNQINQKNENKNTDQYEHPPIIQERKKLQEIDKNPPKYKGKWSKQLTLLQNYIQKYNIMGYAVSSANEAVKGIKQLRWWHLPLFFIYKKFFIFRQLLNQQIMDKKQFIKSIQEWQSFSSSKQFKQIHKKIRADNKNIQKALIRMLQNVSQNLQSYKLNSNQKKDAQEVLNLNFQEQFQDILFYFNYKYVNQIDDVINFDQFPKKKLILQKHLVNVLDSILIGDDKQQHVNIVEHKLALQNNINRQEYIKTKKELILKLIKPIYM